MLDCVIAGGTVIDGTGSERRDADVGIRDGRVVEIGRIGGESRQRIDAAGRVVCPGFVDIHTHFDAQVFWDPALTPSCFHGVTSVAGGHCGFSIAPLTPESGDYLLRMLARVEGMPVAALEAGVPWDWTSFGSYLDRLEGRIALNAGFLVGHSALRRVVMGEDAVGGRATPEQQDAMVALLEESLSAGGLGFSSSNAPTHNDADGQPVPSRHASREEFVRLAAAVRNHPGTTLEFLPTVGPFDEEVMALVTDMSAAANRPLNWNVLVPSRFFPEGHESQLAAGDYAAARGGRVVALTMPQPMSLRINLASGFIFDALPGWAPVIALSHEEKKKALADPAVRRRLDEGAHSEAAGALRAIAVWENMAVDEIFEPSLAKYRGRKLGEIAAERGVEPFDALCDIALEDDLRTSFMPFIPGDDDESWSLRASVWNDPRAMIGASDAGAHLDMIDTFTLTTTFLGTAVRERELLSLESAIQKITDAPARLYGFRERGRIANGWHADIVVFDPDRIGAGPIHTRADLPGGASRLYAEALGIDRVLVNGVEVARDGELTGALPGRVLRSGRDTDTVLASADAR
jgi:N-acyl-D-aspartate/D-glutamate deacylase